MSLNIPCPRCNRRLALPPSVVGRLVQCPACRDTFTAQAPAEDAEPIPLLEAVPERSDPVPTLEPVDQPAPPLRRNSWQRSQEARERKARRSPPREYTKPFSFNVVIHSDSKGELSGPHTAQVTDKGLRLFHRGSEVLLVPPPGPAEYLGGNKLNITYDGRQLEVEVFCGLGPRKKLAHDLAAYLRGEKPSLEPHRYLVPKGYLLLALLPLAMTFAMLGQVIWMAAGIGLALLCFLVAFLCRWTTERRRNVILTVGLSACVVALLGFVHHLFWGPISANDWKNFTSAEARCRMLMPGTPIAKTQFDPVAGQIVIHTVENHLRDYAFIFAAEAIRDGQDLPLEQRFEGARMGMLQKTPGARIVSQRPIDLEGFPGREFVVDYHNKGKIVIRLFIVEDRLYMFGGGGRGYEADNPELKKFFGSFAFTEDPRRWTPRLAVPEQPEAVPPDGVRNQAWVVQRLPARGRHQVHAAAFSPDGEFLAVGEGDHSAFHHLVVWEPKKNTVADSFLNQLSVRSVQAVVFSSDGKLLAGGTDQGEVHLWDWPSGALRRMVKGHNQPVTALAFSPDGKTLASASADVLRLWDVETGQETGQDVRNWHVGQLGTRKETLVFRPDGKYLVTPGNGQEILFLDPRTGAVQFRRTYPDWSGVKVLAFSGDGKLLVAAGHDGNVMPYDGDQGEPILSPDLHFPQMKKHLPIVSLPGTAIRSLAFRKDGLLAVGGDLLALVDPAGRKIIQQLNNAHRVSALSFNSDGQTLAAANLDGETLLFDVSRFDKPGPIVKVKVENPAGGDPMIVPVEGLLQPASVFKTGKGILRHLVVAPDDKHLAAAWTLTNMGKTNMTVALWEASGKAVSFSFPAGFSAGPGWLTFSEDGRQLYMLGRMEILVWDMTGGKPVARLALPKDRLAGIRFLSVSPDGKWLAIRRMNDAVLFQPDKPDEAKTIDPDVLLRAVVFGPNEGQLTLASDGDLFLHRIHEIATSNQVEQRPGPAKGAGRRLLLADGRRMVQAGPDRSIMVWDGLANTTLAFPPNTLDGLPMRAAITADGKRLAVAESDGHVTLLDLQARKKLNRVRLHSGQVGVMVWTPDGKQLLTSGLGEGEIRRWDVAKLEKAK